MTCNNIILAKPEAGASVPYSLPAGESARLSFGPGEISGLNLNADGGLVIRFVQGGELTLTNFQEMVDGGNLLYLADGTLVDPAVLQASLASYISPAAGSDAIVVGIPAANEVKEYNVEAGKDYVLDFDIDTPVTAGRQNGDFVMTFENGGMVVMRGYETAMASADAPTITSTSKVCVYENDELITNIQTLAQAPVVEEKVAVIEEEIVTPKKVVQVEETIRAEEVALVEPAAGEPSAEQIAMIEPAAGEPGASNSGYGFNSQPGSDPLGSLADVGPIDPTMLNYGVEFRQEENRLITPTANPPAPPVANVNYRIDETDDLGQVQSGGKVNVSFGGDGSGRIVPVTGGFSFGGSARNDDLRTGNSDIDVRVEGNSYKGYDEQDNLVFEFAINPLTGAFTYVQYKPFDHADGTDPNDVIHLYFDIKAYDNDNDYGTVKIRVDVLDDAPSIDSSGGAVDETDLANGPVPVIVTGTVTHQTGQDVPANAFVPTGDVPTVGNGMIDGSLMNNTFTSNGVPVVITYANGVYTGTAGNTPVFTMEFDNNGNYTFTLLAPVDHGDPNDPNDIITIDFPVSVRDFDGDTATGSVRIQILDDAPVIGDSRGHVDETNFVNGDLVYTGTVSNTYGQDMSSIVGYQGGQPNNVVYSNGHPVNVGYANGTYTGIANGVVVFTLTIDPATGDYTYTQFRNLDHPDSADHNDIITMNFGVSIRGQADQTPKFGTITIDVADDGPVARNDYSAAEEGQLITGNVVANDDMSTDAPNHVVNVNFDGQDYPITAGGTATIIGTHGTLTIGSDGQWTYVAKADVPDNVVNRDSFTYTLRDRDGDTSTAVLQITVTDDGTPTEYPVNPDAGDDAIAVDETTLNNNAEAVLNGNVRVDSNGETIDSVTGINGSFSAGGSMANGTLTSGNHAVTVTYDAATNTYTGTSADGRPVFTLEIIGTNGDYRFTLKDTLDHADGTDPNDIIRLDFGVRVTDSDGDTADGTITVRVYDDAPVARDDGARTVTDNQTETGNVVLGQHDPDGQADTLGQDGPVHVVQVFFDGLWRDVPQDGTDLVITADYGTLRINNTGAYTYTAFNNNVAGLTDEFAYVLEDFDGDRDTATFSFTTQPDDGPVSVRGQNDVDETDMPVVNGVVGPHVPVNGTVTVTMTGGNAPAPGEVTVEGLPMASNTGLTHKGDPVLVSFNANTGTYTGVAGGVSVFTMVIRADGSYTFTLLQPVDHPDATDHNDTVVLNFPVRATDADGDYANGTIDITVYDDGPSIGNGTNSVDEGDLMPLVVNGTVPHDFGSDGDGEIRGVDNGWNITGSVEGGVNNLHSGGRPVAIRWDDTADAYIGTINNGADEVFRLEIDAATGNFTYTQLRPLDHADPDDSRDVIHMEFDIQIVDYDGDTATGKIKIDVVDDGPTLVVDAVNHAYERDLATGDVTRTGDITVSYGGDGTGSISGRDFFDYSGNRVPNKLTHNDDEVLVRFDPATNTFVGYTTNINDPVFTLVVDPTGSYDFILHKPLDHADYEIDLVFGITATPNVGTAGKVNGVITVTIYDDAPVARDNDGGTTSGTTPNLNGNVLIDDRESQDEPTYVTSIRINGTNYPVDTDTTANTRIETVNGVLLINRDGVWTYTAKDKQNGTDVFAYTITDFDGDSSTANLTVTARDLVPVARDDANATTGTNMTATGNIMTNDTGGDGSTFVTQVVVNGTTYSIPSSGNRVITTPNGTLTIDRTGQYTYQANDKAIGTDVFNYTIRDADLDTANANLTINVHDGVPVANDDFCHVVLPDGKPALWAEVYLFWNDSAGPDGGLALVSLSRNGQTYLPGNTYTIAGQGTLEVRADGTIKFTRDGNNLQGGDLVFNYTIRDTDGDTDTAKVTFRMDKVNGVPVANDDFCHVVLADGRPAQWAEVDLFWNDSAGPDGGLALVSLTRGTATYLPGNTYTIAGQGTLEVRTNGTIKFTRDNSNLAGSDLVFTYTVRDADGDRDSARVTFRLPSVVTPLVLDLTGDGIALTTLQGGVYFDLDNDGVVNRTAWVAEGTGVLAIDRNGDGIINDQTELFGNTDRHADGFENLASHDANKDGVIDENDDIWGDLRVWNDANRDGATDAGELLTLAQIGIVSINLTTELPENLYIDGNWISHIGSFTMADGSVRQIMDAWFEFEQGYNHVEASGLDDVYGNEGADVFLFSTIGEEVTTVHNFNVAEGDRLDISAVLQEQDDVSHAIDDFVYARQENGDLVISVDVTRSGVAANAVDIARLDGMEDLDLESLLQNGNITI